MFFGSIFYKDYGTSTRLMQDYSLYYYEVVRLYSRGVTIGEKGIMGRGSPADSLQVFYLLTGSVARGKA